MIKKNAVLLALIIVVAIGSSGVLEATTPPARLNVQGVLRDALGNPLSGTHPMTLRLYDTDLGCPGGGNLLLTDDHAGIAITGGLFNAVLGDGTLTPGLLPTLPEALSFRADLWLEIMIGPEVLCPRIRLESAGSALNADRLDGQEASAFALVIDLDAEAAARAAADQLLQDLLDAEAAARQVADVQLAEALLAEELARVAADGALATALLQEESDRLAAESALQDAINNEATSRQDADAQLAADLAAEAASRQAADDAEQTARLDADSQLAADLAAEAASRQAADDAEQTARLDADTQLAADLAAEAASRQAADAQLAADLAQEAADRVAADSNGTDPGHTHSTLDAPGGSPPNALTVDTNGSVTVDSILVPHALRLLGPAPSRSQARLNFGDLDFVFIEEPTDNVLEIHADLGVVVTSDLNVTGLKNFTQPHPLDPSREIRFTSLEGNESGTYFRGSTRLSDGGVVIDVPEEFRLVSESGGLSVQVTSRGADAGLWVESADLDEVIVRGSADVEFDYLVNGIRRGFRELEIVRQNTSFVPVVRGVPYGGQYPEAYRRILVDNGTLNADFTPNETTARDRGWTLRSPTGVDPIATGLPGPEHDMAAQDIEESPSEPQAVLTVEAVESPVELAERYEYFPVREVVEVGHVLVADGEQTGLLAASRAVADPTVVGIVAETGTPLREPTGEDPAAPLEDADEAWGVAPVAFSGITLCKVDAGYGAIRTGDLLTTSATPGHAMRSVEFVPGTVVGKALEPLETGTGLIRVLVMLR